MEYKLQAELLLYFHFVNIYDKEDVKLRYE